MVEETGNDKTTEVVPPEDCKKVPLTEDGPNPTIEEAKFVSNPNGEAKIDVGVPPAFSGLTKEELMKYSNDPFWVRLRWFLFISFWLGWVAMLIVAIVIIVQAPGCKPPPELLWVEENAAFEIDQNVLPTKEELLASCAAMDVKSVYFPDLISTSNFQETNYDARELIVAIAEAKLEAVTDLPSFIAANNPFYKNASGEHLILEDGTWNYSNPALPTAVYNEIIEWWIGEGVKGFLIQATDTEKEEMFKDKLNDLAKDNGGAVSSDIIDTEDHLGSPSMFKEFLEDHSTNWTFNRFNPNVAIGSAINANRMALTTIAMFLSLGTPLVSNFGAYKSEEDTSLVKNLSSIRAFEGIKFGTVNFVNTSETVLAFTRVYKGTPAYAVALNYGHSNETVSFLDTPNVGDKGTVEIQSNLMKNYFHTGEKIALDTVELSAYQGVVIQFVAAGF